MHAAEPTTAPLWASVVKRSRRLCGVAPQRDTANFFWLAPARAALQLEGGHRGALAENWDQSRCVSPLPGVADGGPPPHPPRRGRWVGLFVAPSAASAAAAARAHAPLRCGPAAGAHGCPRSLLPRPPPRTAVLVATDRRPCWPPPPRRAGGARATRSARRRAVSPRPAVASTTLPRRDGGGQTRARAGVHWPPRV